VTASIFFASTPSAKSLAYRLAITNVLPLPGPANTRTALLTGASIANNCLSLGTLSSFKERGGVSARRGSSGTDDFAKTSDTPSPSEADKMLLCTGFSSGLLLSLFLSASEETKKALVFATSNHTKPLLQARHFANGLPLFFPSFLTLKMLFGCWHSLQSPALMRHWYNVRSLSVKFSLQFLVLLVYLLTFEPNGLPVSVLTNHALILSLPVSAL